MDDFSALRRDELARTLRAHTAGEIRFDAPSRRLYSTDASIYQVEPFGVFLPRTADDLRAAVQIAVEMRVPLVPRGGGTSLSGQSIGPGLVLDCSKYLNHVLDIDPAGRRARVQPGVVLDQLNREVGKHGLLFGPDVATSSRANLGGMLGNNSAGSRSVVYGKTGDHTRSLNVILGDGSAATLSRLSTAEYSRRAKFNTLEGAIYREVRQEVVANADEIRKRFPNIIRRVSGYNLLDLVPQFEAPVDDGPGVLPLIIGGEGTLGVIAEAELNLVPKPKHRGLLVPHYESFPAALDSLATCLEAGPSAVELIDALLIELSANNFALRDVMKLIHGKPAALFFVEFSGDDAAEIADRVDKLRGRLLKRPGVTAAVPALDAEKFNKLWNFRASAVPLLYGMPGDRKPVTFCEDAAVSPEKLPEFAAKFRELLRGHGTDGAFYGHASVGCLHIRPVLNLKDSEDVARMRRIMDDVTDLTLAFGGSLSGEHGDGMVRSEWNRKMYGPVVYDIFRRVKKLFDPHNLMNPGKVVDGPPMTESLRLGPDYTPVPVPTVFDYSGQESFFQSIELCNGAGVCRKTQGGAMCPSYRATLDERDSTRGRANALRLAVQGVGVERPAAPLASRWLYDVMDLCLMCKACKSECPSNVDLAKLKAEFLHSYYKHKPRPVGHRLMANIHLINALSAPLGPLVNWVGRLGWVRSLMQGLGGIDRRRSLPPLHADHFRRWFDGRKRRPGPRRVILLDDCFTTFNEPTIGRAAVSVLEAAGYAVERANICCGRAMISKGFLTEARSRARTTLPKLARRVADGTPILGLEPSCLLTLADEWPDLVPGRAAKRVAAAALLLDDWLAARADSGDLALPLRRRSGACVLHGHCHQKALVGVTGSAQLLKLIPGLDVKVLETGCCGMAGSFGYEREHFDISARIANQELLPALAAAPEAVVAAPGTSCRHQIHDLAGRRAYHPIELVESVLDLAGGPR